MPGSHDPCAGHQCDHCWVCTNLGVCCAQVPHIKAIMSPDRFVRGKNREEEFKLAIAADSGLSPQLSMVELVRLDVNLQLTTSTTDDTEEVVTGEPALGVSVLPRQLPIHPR